MGNQILFSQLLKLKAELSLHMRALLEDDRQSRQSYWASK